MASDRASEARLFAEYRAHLQNNRPVPAATTNAIDALFADNQGRVYAACRRIVRDPELARELAQETLLLGYQKLGTFRGDSAFSTWLYGIARGLCLNRVRRRGELLTEDGVLDAADGAANAVSLLRRQEREVLLHQATQGLSALEQEAIHLRYVEGLPLEAITSLLKLETASGARGLLQKCRRSLSLEMRARAGALGHGSSLFRASTT